MHVISPSSQTAGYSRKLDEYGECRRLAIDYHLHGYPHHVVTGGLKLTHHFVQRTIDAAETDAIIEHAPGCIFRSEE